MYWKKVIVTRFERRREIYTIRLTIAMCHGDSEEEPSRASSSVILEISPVICAVLSFSFSSMRSNLASSRAKSAGVHATWASCVETSICGISSALVPSSAEGVMGMICMTWIDRCGGLNFSMGLSDRAQSEHKMQSIHVPSFTQWSTMKIVPNSPVHRRQQYISPAMGLSHVPSHILISGLALTCTSWLDTADSHRNVSHDKSISGVESD